MMAYAALQADSLSSIPNKVPHLSNLSGIFAKCKDEGHLKHFPLDYARAASIAVWANAAVLMWAACPDDVGRRG
jgi:hypothetical protein